MISTRHYGFMLLEVLIAVFLFGVAALGITMLQARLIKATTTTSQHAKASLLAQQKMESLRNYPTFTAYSSIASGTDETTDINTTYNRTWFIITNALPDYKNVNITVSWINSEGVTESVALASTISGIDPALSGRVISSYIPILP